MSIEDLRRTLHDHAESVGPDRMTASQRTTAVLRRARTLQRRRAVGTTSLAACAAAAVVAVLAPQVPGERAVSPAAPSPTSTAGTATTAPEGTATPTPEGTPSPTPATQDRTKTGWRYPETIDVDGETFDFGTSYETAPGERALRMEVEIDPSAPSRAMAWSTSPSTKGEVTVTIDGEEVARGTAGRLVSGELLPVGRSYVVVVRAPRLAADEQIAVAVYEPQQ